MQFAEQLYNKKGENHEAWLAHKSYFCNRCLVKHRKKRCGEITSYDRIDSLARCIRDYRTMEYYKFKGKRYVGRHEQWIEVGLRYVVKSKRHILRSTIMSDLVLLSAEPWKYIKYLEPTWKDLGFGEDKTTFSSAFEKSVRVYWLNNIGSRLWSGLNTWHRELKVKNLPNPYKAYSLKRNLVIRNPADETLGICDWHLLRSKSKIKIIDSVNFVTRDRYFENWQAEYKPWCLSISRELFIDISQGVALKDLREKWKKWKQEEKKLWMKYSM